MVQNVDNFPHTVRVSVAFVDLIEAHILFDSTSLFYKTGDLLPIDQREIQTGQMCFVGFTVPANATANVFLRLHSYTDISRQFRPVALRSLQLYAENAFQERFETSRIYQALFYGAILTMLFYNLFIYSTTRSSGYLSYVKFLFWLILFMSSNNGYVAELLLPNHPRLDLYLRFLSAPLLVFSFLLFSKRYLETSKYAPILNKWILGLLVMYPLICVVMCAGYWRIGRTLTIETSIVSFLFILYVSIVVMRKGFTPAKYFFIANFMLIVGAVLYATERYDLVTHHLLSQYSVQLAVVFQSVFFSIGLADRIKLVTAQMAKMELEKDKLEKQQEVERNHLIAEKNIALEKSNRELDAFIYKTAHDIRGPIARLMGLSNLGLMDIQDEKALKYFAMLKANSDFLNYLLNRLSTAHEIKNQAVFKLEFNLNKLVQEVLSNLSFHDEYASVSFSIHIEKDATVSSDFGLIRFILLNLLDNAIKFRNPADQHAPPISIEGKVNADCLQIRISDYGIGVEEGEVPYLFDMFTKAAGKHHTPGLGLYMSNLCAEKLNGTITLAHPGHPTVFELQVPL